MRSKIASSSIKLDSAESTSIFATPESFDEEERELDDEELDELLLDVMI